MLRPWEGSPATTWQGRWMERVCVCVCEKEREGERCQ